MSGRRRNRQLRNHLLSRLAFLQHHPMRARALVAFRFAHFCPSNLSPSCSVTSANQARRLPPHLVPCLGTQTIFATSGRSLLQVIEEEAGILERRLPGLSNEDATILHPPNGAIDPNFGLG